MQHPSDLNGQLTPRRPWENLCANAINYPTTHATLAAAAFFGITGFLVWCRPYLEDGAFLMILLGMATWKLLKVPLASRATANHRRASWLMLMVAATAMAAAAALSHGLSEGQRELLPLLCKHVALLFLATAVILRKDGLPAAAHSLSMLALAILVLPLYELLLLEFSYPLRQLSTMVSVGVLKLCAFHVQFDGTSLFWGNQTLSITEGCSGISLMGLFVLLEYLIIQPLRTSAWKKWSWSFLLVLWLTLGNALRLLLTVLLFRVIGERVYAPRPHFLLGCFFVVTTSMLIWLSSFLFKLDQPPPDEP